MSTFAVNYIGHKLEPTRLYVVTEGLQDTHNQSSKRYLIFKMVIVANFVSCPLKIATGYEGFKTHNVTF